MNGERVLIHDKFKAENLRLINNVDILEGTEFTIKSLEINRGRVRMQTPLNMSRKSTFSIDSYSELILNADGNEINGRNFSMLEGSSLEVNGKTSINAEEFITRYDSKINVYAPLEIQATRIGEVGEISINAPLNLKGKFSFLSYIGVNAPTTITGDVSFSTSSDLKIDAPLNLKGKSTAYNIIKATFTSQGHLIADKDVYFQRLEAPRGAKLEINGVCRTASKSGKFFPNESSTIVKVDAIFDQPCP